MKNWRIWVLLGALVAPGAVVADDEIFIDLNLGIANTDAANFDESGTADISASYVTHDFIFAAGFMGMDKFTLDGVEVDAYVQSEGPYIKAAKIIEFRPLNLEIGGGLFRARSESSFDGRQVGKTYDSSPFLQIRAVKDVSRLVSYSAGYTIIDDLAGSTASVFNAGVRFRF